MKHSKTDPADRAGPLRGVLLDIDGTLLDSNAAHAEAWVEACGEFGHPVAFDVVRPLIGKGGDKLMAEALGIDDESDEGRRIAERRKTLFTRQHLADLKPTKGARELLEHLKGLGLRLVVATSATGEELEALLFQAGVHDLIELDATASSNDAEASKPDPDIIRAALHKAGLRPHDVLMLGDTPYDIQSARSAGVDTIALRCGGWWSDDAFSGAVAIHDHPADLLAHPSRDWWRR